MKKNRSRKALENTIAGFIKEFVVLLCGLILPRLILSRFGSAYNGITSSITQFVSCIALMKSGIGGVTRAALYKPLAEGNTQEISEIVVQTEKFMRRVSMIFIVFTAVFAMLYPVFVTDFPWLFTATLILIISLSTFIQYYFGLTYQMVLNADQRQGVVSLVISGTTILNTVVAAILIWLGFGIHAVKLGSTMVYALNPLILSTYTRKKYHIDRTVSPKRDLIKQRWDAMGHEVANFVNSNTDIMVLTVFAGIMEVSVYSVYYYVIRGIRMVVTTFITGFGAAFGNMYAKKEYALMQKNLGIYELIVYSVSTIVYATTFVMLVPFAMIYTQGITDVNYSRPVFSAIITIAGAFSCYRIPYQTIVTAVGHYKQTRNGAIFEAVMNITISVIAVMKFGLVGVAVGTLAATVFRTCQYGTYLSKNILPRRIWMFVKHILVSLGVIGVTFLISKSYMKNVTDVVAWIWMAVITFAVATVLTVVVSLLCFREDFLEFIRKIKGMFGKKRVR